MSYDLYVFNSGGGDPGERWREIAKAVETMSWPAPTAAGEQSKHEIADQLVAFDPTLERFVPDPARMAAVQGITEDEARRIYRYVELNGEAVQITVSDDYASLSFPYWESSDRDELRRSITGFCGVIQRAAGWNTIFDPQLERVIGEDDLDRIVSKFDRGVDVTRKAVEDRRRT